MRAFSSRPFDSPRVRCRPAESKRPDLNAENSRPHRLSQNRAQQTLSRRSRLTKQKPTPYGKRRGDERDQDEPWVGAWTTRFGNHAPEVSHREQSKQHAGRREIGFHGRTSVEHGGMTNDEVISRWS